MQQGVIVEQSDVVTAFLEYGLLGALCLILFWRLWRVSDRFTEHLLKRQHELAELVREMTKAQQDQTAALNLLAEKIERAVWRSD